MAKSKNVTTTRAQAHGRASRRGLPGHRLRLGKAIAVHLAKAHKHEEKAEQHYTAVAQYLAEAKKLATTAALMCSGKSFSRTWASRVFMSCLRSRPAKSRSRKTAPRNASASKDASEQKGRGVRYSTGKVGGAGAVRAAEAPTEVAPADAPSIVPEQTPEAAKPRSAVTPKDEALFDFTARVRTLFAGPAGRRSSVLPKRPLRRTISPSLESSLPTLRTSRSAAPFAATARFRRSNRPKT